VVKGKVAASSAFAEHIGIGPTVVKKGDSGGCVANWAAQLWSRMVTNSPPSGIMVESGKKPGPMLVTHRGPVLRADRPEQRHTVATTTSEADSMSNRTTEQLYADPPR
jgi:hypothetical protein